MKATRKTLHDIGVIKEPIDLLTFGDEVGFFRYEGSQRVQNMQCELSLDEFKKAYDNYLDDGGIKLSNYPEIQEGVYLLDWRDITLRKKGCYLLEPEKNIIKTRIIQKVKSRGGQHFLRNNGENILVKDTLLGY